MLAGLRKILKLFVESLDLWQMVRKLQMVSDGEQGMEWEEGKMLVNELF